jgi:hypothetical protein
VNGIAPTDIEDPLVLVNGRNFVYLKILLNVDFDVQSATVERASSVPANPTLDSETGEIDWPDPSERLWYFSLGYQDVETEDGELVMLVAPANTGSGSLNLETFAGTFQYVEPTETTDGGLAQTTRLRTYRIG